MSWPLFVAAVHNCKTWGGHLAVPARAPNIVRGWMIFGRRISLGFQPSRKIDWRAMAQSVVECLAAIGARTIDARQCRWGIGKPFLPSSFESQ